MIGLPGIYDISNEAYHADPCVEPSLSRGVIHDLLSKSPAHAWWNHPRLNPDYKAKNNSTFDLGSAAHPLLLEGCDNCVVVDAPDWRKKDAQEAREQAYEDGKTPLLKEQYERAIVMVQAAERQIVACKELGINSLSEGKAEPSFIWQEGQTWFRTRPDWLSNDNRLIIDYKTTGASADPGQFARAIIDHAYDVQAALYSAGVEKLTGIKPSFVFAVQETYPPFLMSFISLSPEFMEMGESKVIKGTILWEQCMKSGKWPGYPQRIAYPDVPTWAAAQWEIKAQEIGV